MRLYRTGEVAKKLRSFNNDSTAWIKAGKNSFEGPEDVGSPFSLNASQ